MQSLEIALLPAEAVAVEADCYIVIDALRATSTAAVLFGRGLVDLVAVESLELARELAARDGRLLFGEVDGVAPEGFQFGNSPVEASTADVAGRGAVLFTTNGTKAFCSLAARGAAVLGGALTNATAVVKAMAQADNVAIVCAGNAGGRRFALEDFFAAGAIASLAHAAYPEALLGDAARLGIAAAATADMAEDFASTRHGQITAARGFAGDIAYAARLDLSTAVPVTLEFGKGWARLADLNAR
nr:D194 [uncultured bacterium]